MKRIVNKSTNFKEAQDWNIEQQINMTSKQRMQIAKRLKKRAYGNKNKDVRECYQRNR